jgi:hypothetical protein
MEGLPCRYSTIFNPPTTREVWLRCKQQLEVNFEIPTMQSTLEEWWLRKREKVQGMERKWFDTLVGYGRT